MSILFPLSKKSSLPAITSPREYSQQVARGISLPENAIICPILPLTNYVTAHTKWKKIYALADIYVLEGKNLCYITNFGMGAPSAALVTELALALGVKQAIYLGLAGSLQEEVEQTDIVLCNEAICGDGTSPAYTAKELIKPNCNLQKKLAQILRSKNIDFHVGRNWTTDAILRETKAEIHHYQQNAVLTVEMETAAFYAVCAKRKARAMAAFVISDVLTHDSWQKRFDKRIFRGLETLFECTQLSLR